MNMQMAALFLLLGAGLASAQEDPREKAAREAVNGVSDSERSAASSYSVNADDIRRARGAHKGKGVTLSGGSRYQRSPLQLELNPAEVQESQKSGQVDSE